MEKFTRFEAAQALDQLEIIHLQALAIKFKMMWLRIVHLIPFDNKWKQLFGCVKIVGSKCFLLQSVLSSMYNDVKVQSPLY